MTAKEKRLGELTALLKDKDMAPLSSRARVLQVQISQSQAALDGRISQIAAYAQLPAYRARVQQLSSDIQAFQSNQQVLAQNSQQIESLHTEIKELSSSRDDAVMNRDLQSAELRIAERESGTARAAKTTAQDSLDAANGTLTAKKAQIKAAVERKMNQKAAKKENALRDEESSYQISLTQLTQNFKDVIAMQA